MRSIRSWDSLSSTSSAVMPSSRRGTRLRSISIPTPPRADISARAQVSPAAPISWIAMTAPEARASRLASMSSLPVNGSPICTAERSRGSPASSADAKEAPWIPSRPVRAPR